MGKEILNRSLIQKRGAENPERLVNSSMQLKKVRAVPRQGT
jgi:hypothetical protein